MSIYANITLKSITEAINCNSPALAVIRKENGETTTLAVLVIILNDLAKFFNVGKTFNDYQIAETCKLILQEYYFLKIEDFKLCFDGMKTGKYLPGGQLFDRLDGNIILTALNTYSEERIQQAEIISNEKHKAMMDEVDEDFYLVKIGKNYLMETEQEFSEVKAKDMARKYNFREAIARKNYMISEFELNDVSIVYSNKSEIGFIDYLKSNRPDLVPEEKKPEPKKSYSALTYAIQMDNTLTDLQKENKIRGLSGLVALSADEFKTRQELLKKMK